LYAQRDGIARGDLLERYRNDPHGILLGLASFWEGVDLPGDLVEIVVIVKMPFLVPDDPVVQARSHRLSSTGENPFEKLFIPDVVLRLRQGMGRLIRTSSDRGAVILLDRRLHESEYGAVVMDGVASDGFDLVDSNQSMVDRVASVFIDQ
jgi:ATP-dependent DNA helicase DinG